MRAMVLEQTRTPLIMRERPTPEPKQGEILVEIAACGVCRTDLHVVDGELPNPKLPIVPGHEIVGRIAAIGSGVAGFAVGDRVGVPWLGFTCGVCCILLGRSGEPVRSAAVYRLYPRRRLCHSHDRRCTLLFSAAGADGRCGGSALLLCGADRLAQLPHGRGRERGSRFARSGSTGSGPPRISSAKLRTGKAAGFMPSPAAATPPHHPSIAAAENSSVHRRLWAWPPSRV